MPFLLALDQGTTSSRAIVFDEQGQVVALRQREFKQYYPRPGWVEHDAEEIWSSQLGVAIEAIAAAKLSPRDVAAIGVTNQRETVVLWDRATGVPLHSAIVWQDRRTSDVCDELRKAGHEKVICEKTGLVIDPYFTGTKIAWLLDNVEGARKAAERGKLACGTIDSWLAWNLLGGARHITDVSNASRTLLMNIHTGEWDDELLKILRVPREVLPEICSSSEVYGEVASNLPLSSIKLAGMAGDQQSALFGQSCFEQGGIKNTYGTGCFMLMNTGTEAVASEHRLLTTVAWRIGERIEYALEGSVFIGGAVVGWLRDGLGIIKSSRDVEPLANTVADNGGLAFVPAFAGLGAPDWDPYARGTIIGITGGTTAGHIARAALEGIALQVTDLVEGMQSDAGFPIAELRVDGGASVNDTLLQIQADLGQVPVVRPKITETTALGVAYLAGIATGIWNSREAIAPQWQIDKRFEPKIAADEARERRAVWHRAVERAKAWAKP